ncbi:hypothetical protein OsccyDRAFT_0612 [Leptolyngbyaceae cyanobacterium JSC-12]|nr:hypothetical protein OsccyDRAFT_0612 [Leptolyngbyaceae cyanobacterium JSC-12]
MYLLFQERTPDGVAQDDDDTLATAIAPTVARGSVALYALSGTPTNYESAGFAIYAIAPRNVFELGTTKGSIFAGRGWAGAVRTTGSIDMIIPFRYGFYGLGAVLLGSKPILSPVGMRFQGTALWQNYKTGTKGGSRVVRRGTDISPTTTCSTARWWEDDLLGRSSQLRNKIDTFLDGETPPIIIKQRFPEAAPRGTMPKVPATCPLVPR